MKPGATLSDSHSSTRDAKLRKRIKHLELEMVKMQDQIAIMEAEIKNG